MINYSNQRKREASINNLQNFASQWQIEGSDEDLSQDAIHSTSDSVIAPLLWEPCEYQGIYSLLPIELFSLTPSQIISDILSFENWQSLLPQDKAQLQRFLPQDSHSSDSDTSSCLNSLFSLENIKFGSPLSRFAQQLSNGEFNVVVAKYKEQIKTLEKKRHLLAIKSYHARMVRSVLTYKRKIGLKVNSNLIEFYRSFNDDADRQERRFVERSSRKLKKRSKRYKKEKQLTSLITAATKIAASDSHFLSGQSYLGWDSNQLNGTHRGSSLPLAKIEESRVNPLTAALAEIGIRLFKSDQIGLPRYEEDIFLSQEESDLSDTCSLNSGSDLEMDSFVDDELLEKKRKKRKREEIDGGSDASSMALMAKRKREKRKERRKMLPPLPHEEAFSLFSTIKMILESSEDPVPFNEILKVVESNAKLVLQAPIGYTMKDMLGLALKMLSKPPPDFALILNPNNSNAGVNPANSNDAHNSSAFSPELMTLVPIVNVVKINKDSQDQDQGQEEGDEDFGYIWNLDASHALCERLEQLEIVFFFALTRNQFTRDGQELEFNLSKQMKATQTLDPTPEHICEEFRQQERERFNNAEVPYIYRFSDPVPGSWKFSIAAPLRNPVSTSRPHTSLRPDRPPFASLLALVRDALSRMPGGVGTRPDVTLLLKDSQYVLDNVESTQLNTVVSGGLDRLHSEYDPCVRFDNDLKLWINLHRQRNEEDHMRMKDVEDKIKLIDVSTTINPTVSTSSTSSSHNVNSINQNEQESYLSHNGWLDENTDMPQNVTSILKGFLEDPQVLQNIPDDYAEEIEDIHS